MYPGLISRKCQFLFFRRATSYPCPPSPVSSPFPDFRNKGDFVVEPLIDEIKRDISGPEFRKKIEKLQLLTAQSCKTKYDRYEAVACQREEKIRRVLDRVIFTPNRALNASLQLLRKKLSFYVNLRKQDEQVRSAKLLLACGDQVKPNEKVRYKWSHSKYFTLHSKLPPKM